MIDGLLLRSKTLRKKAIRAQGNLTIEFVLLLPLFSILGVLGVSCYLFVLTSWMNDSACRDACRAAAQQITAEDAKLAASAACRRFATGIGQPQVSLASGDFEYEIFPNAKGQPTLESGPYVKITTTLNGVKLPISGLVGDINCKRSYTYPLVNNSGVPAPPADVPLVFNDASDADGNDNK